MSKKRIITLAALLALITVLMVFTVSAESGGTWIPLEGGNWSYMDADGELVKGQTGYYIDGYYYGFDANGIMYKGWVQPNLLYLNGDREYRTRWYFFDDSGRALGYGYDPETGYLFNWNGAVLANGSCTWWDEEANCERFFVSDAEGRAIELVQEGWNQVNGNWHYVFDDNGYKNMYANGKHTIDGVEYYFTNGHLAAYIFVRMWDAGDGELEFYVDGAGHPIYDGWILHEGEYYYLRNGERLGGGIYTIGENQYYFYWGGRMATNEWVEGYYATESGALIKDQWYLTDDGEWTYIDADGDRLSGGLYTIGDVTYYFDYNGYLVTDRAQEIGQYIPNYGYTYLWYYCDTNGAATPVADGWLFTDNGWMYFKEGQPYSDRVYTINGTEYAFNGYYLYDKETVVHLLVEQMDRYAYVHVNADGTVNKTPGWKLLDEKWILVDGSGYVRDGWTYDGGRWYYLYPYMAKNEFLDIGGRAYYFDSNGNYTEVYGNGFQTMGGGQTFYFEYGAPAYGWRLLNGNWYYFVYDMVTNDDYYIGSDRYYFNQDGIMQTGWFKDNYGDWRYADANGHLASGMVNLDGVNYLFYSDGSLITNGIYTVDGVGYLADENGVVFAKNTDPSGWIQHNGKWYYLNGSYFYDYGIYTIDGVDYRFENYVLQEDVIYGSHYFGVGGGMVTDDWFMKEGKWYYAWESGYLAYGLCTIDGQQYYFGEDRSLTIGTFVYGTDIVTTDDGGRIVAAQPYAEGWNLISDKGYGAWYYVQDGELRYGWIGNYYVNIRYGMYHSGVHDVPNENTDDYDFYYFDENGNCAKGGWVFDGEYWLYAQADGKLITADWLLLDGTYYYFGYRGSMLEDGVYEIDGKWHRFAEGGAWLGETAAETYSDGWQLINGNWHYYEGGDRYDYGLYCIDGTWYGFNYNGLQSNTFVNDYYVDANGIMVPYTGWQQINGEWYYFTAEHKVATGWFTVNSVQYCGYYNGLVTGYYAYGGVLYQFDESGAFIGTVTQDGWYAGNDTWYYVRDGKLLKGGIYNIDGTNYAFYGDGTMYVNEIYHGGYDYGDGSIYLFLGNGAQATQGWYLIYGEWLYVDANGYLCTGTHVIDGVTYNFESYRYYI